MAELTPPYASESFRTFLLAAKSQAYATGAYTEDSLRGEEVTFGLPPYYFSHKYVGLDPVTGFQRIAVDLDSQRRETIWSMVYFGRILDSGFTEVDYDDMLREVDKRGPDPVLPIRGPLDQDVMMDGYRYRCWANERAHLGDFALKETIWSGSVGNDRKVYIAEFRGGFGNHNDEPGAFWLQPTDQAS